VIVKKSRGSCSDGDDQARAYADGGGVIVDGGGGAAAASQHASLRATHFDDQLRFATARPAIGLFRGVSVNEPTNVRLYLDCIVSLPPRGELNRSFLVTGRIGVFRLRRTTG
jgi:hypothetical protein